MEAILVISVCVSDVISDRKKDLSKMKSLLDILTDPSKRYSNFVFLLAGHQIPQLFQKCVV